MLSLARGDVTLFAYYRNVALGRLEGWRGKGAGANGARHHQAGGPGAGLAPLLQVVPEGPRGVVCFLETQFRLARVGQVAFGLQPRHSRVEPRPFGGAQLLAPSP